MQRIVGYDIARAFAVFGMVVVNFKIAMGASSNGPDWLIWAVSLLEGRAAATFVVLAGVGLSLMSRVGHTTGDPARLATDRNTLLRRALFLFVVGLLYTPIWPADILHFYGVYIAVAALMLAAPTRRLWTVASALVFTFPILILTLDYERGWNFETLEYSGLWTADGMLRHLFFNGFHPVVPWLAFLLVGMVLGRLDMRAPKVRRSVFVWGTLAALLAEALSWLLIRLATAGASAADQQDIAALLGTEPMPPMPLYMIAGTGTACAVIAACVALGQRFPKAGWLRPLIDTGQLALTLYVAHVLVGMGTLEALGRLDDQSLAVSLFASAIFCTAGVIFATLWRRRFQRGPLEALMRRLTR